MICSFSVENFKAFGDRIEVDFFANGNIKRFDYNCINVNEKKILKSTGFYGPNNTGKTCVLRALQHLRALMLNEPHLNMINSFANKGTTTIFEIEYYINDSFYVYKVEYDNRFHAYSYEKLVRRIYDEKQHANKKDNVLIERRLDKIKGSLIPNSIGDLYSVNFPVMLMMNLPSNNEFVKAKNDYEQFAKSLVLLMMDRPIDISKTIALMDKDKKAKEFIQEFVKNCDINIEEFNTSDNLVSDVDVNEDLRAALSDPLFPRETLKIQSKHNGLNVPSIFFDSNGTLKIMALAGYIYDALVHGYVLMIDEIDCSLHHLITRAILAMFNNMLNKKAQLLFTTHDVLLMDLKTLFRKDQIWLTDLADKCNCKLIRLSSFTARAEDGIRGDEDIVEYYLKGRFGSVPTPDLFTALEGAVNNE